MQSVNVYLNSQKILQKSVDGCLGTVAVGAFISLRTHRTFNLDKYVFDPPKRGLWGLGAHLGGHISGNIGWRGEYPLSFGYRGVGSRASTSDLILASTAWGNIFVFRAYWWGPLNSGENGYQVFAKSRTQWGPAPAFSEVAILQYPFHWGFRREGSENTN